MIRRELIYLGLYLLLCVPILIIYINFSMKTRREWLTLTGRVKPIEVTEEQKREYIRLESAFPVEFQKVEEKEEKEEEFDIHQGFTKDISKSGMSIEALTARGKRLEELVPDQTRLRLIINVPTEPQAIITQATVRWVRKIEETAVDRYLIGVSYDDIAEPDIAKIMKYALWFRRRPDILGITIVIVLVLIAAFFITTLIFRNERSQLEKRLTIAQEEKMRLSEEVDTITEEREKSLRDLQEVTQRYATLQEMLKRVERDREYQKKRFTEEEEKIKGLEAQLVKEKPSAEEEVTPEAEEAEPKEAEELEEALEPVVELRRPVAPEDEIVVEPNITRRMIEAEKDVYKMFRDYILKEDIQLLDRYASLHRTSIYHAAGLFALAEMRYKNRHIKEMIIKAYRDVIKLHPRSKYASYASHRLEQIERNLPYETHSLRYYYTEYNLPPLFDYRELEPYKE